MIPPENIFTNNISVWVFDHSSAYIPAPHPIHLICLDVIALIMSGENLRIMKFLIMQLSPFSCYFLCFRLQYLFSALLSSTLQFTSLFNSLSSSNMQTNSHVTRISSGKNETETTATRGSSTVGTLMILSGYVLYSINSRALSVMDICEVIL
jgi:hypothetical protein